MRISNAKAEKLSVVYRQQSMFNLILWCSCWSLERIR